MSNIDDIRADDAHADAAGGEAPGGGSRELAFDCGGLRFLIVDAAGAGMAACLDPDRTTRVPATTDGAAADVRYVVNTWQPKWGAVEVGYRIARNGELRYLGSNLERAVQWLRTDVEESVARRASTGLSLSATVVAWRGRAILLCGQGGCGTSTLVAELVRHGATEWSDGLAVLDDEGAVRPDGVSAATSPMEVALVLSTIYFAEASWEPRRMKGARAALPLIASALTERNDPHAVLRLSARLATTALTLQGARPEASVAAPRILAAVDTWLDGDPPARAKPLRTRGVVSRTRRSLLVARGGGTRIARKRPRGV